MPYINHSFLKTFLITFCLLSVLSACKQPSKENLVVSNDNTANANTAPVQTGEKPKLDFKRTPEAGQRRNYSIKYVVKSETKSSESAREADLRKEDEDSLEMRAILETRVISIQPNGNWKLSCHFTTSDYKLDGKRVENNNPAVASVTFIVAMNKDGELLNVSENQKAALKQGDPLGLENPLLILPWLLLPRKSIEIGETWNNESSSLLSNATDVHHSLDFKGSGVVKAVNDNQAVMELTFNSELHVNSPKSESRKWMGKGTMKTVYDLKQAQFIHNKVEMTRETIGFAVSDNHRDTKSILTESLQVDLIN